MLALMAKTADFTSVLQQELRMTYAVFERNVSQYAAARLN